MINKHLTLLTGIFTLLSCSGGDSEEDPIEVNSPPSAPTLAAPENNALCTESTLDFRWEIASDPDGGELTYLLEVSEDSQFNEIAYSATGTGTVQSLDLEKNTAYYWRVQATDNQDASGAFSQTFSMYTEGEGVSNYLPFVPRVIYPTQEDTVPSGEVNLQWTAEDVDEDPLIFDLYFGTQNPPETMVSENNPDPTFIVQTNPATTYYWRVTAKDDKGGITLGQINIFTTD